jgi:hypothetical protein
MDCTFNLTNAKWAHYNYGTTNLRRTNTLTGPLSFLSHEFIPISFGISRTEIGENYRRLIHATNDFVKTYYACDMVAKVTCIDHNTGAANAILATGGDVTLCWEHIQRNAMKTTGKSKLVDKFFLIRLNKTLSQCTYAAPNTKWIRLWRSC